MMEQHEIDAQLSEAQALLDATSSAHLAYVAKDGTPRTMPVGFYWTGNQFIVATAETAPKVKALMARPDVAMSVERGDTPGDARALSVRGRAEITIIDGVVEEYLLAARKSMGAEAAAEFEKNCRQMYDRMARIAITPTWAQFYDFNVGRMPRFLQELAQRNMS
jgi:nitroimidazol reductase NimA-like FMN-containing flavoprotein (pyridoxamine 5'-phosphate oxidase superfamily)